MTRDRFLDMLRAIAIVRVVIVHMSGATETLGWPLLAYVAPGMPLVFFVSGSLALASLDPRRESHRSDASFRRDRLRRLLVPYWAFIATIVLIGVAWDLASEWADDSVRWSMVARSIVPLAVPRISPRVGVATGHLWFMSSFLVMTVLAPQMVRLYRRLSWAPAAITGATFAVVQSVEAFAEFELPHELDRLSLFAFCYVAGFWYQDGRAIWERSTHVVVAAALAVVAVAYHRVDRAIPNATEPMHALVGAAWLQVLLAARPAIQWVGERCSAVLGRITKRTLTVYLWGWPTTMAASRLARSLGWTGAMRTACIYVAGLGLLAVAVAVFGSFEDQAAGRARVRRIQTEGSLV